MKNAGFTLMELLVVLAIMGTLAFFILPSVKLPDDSVQGQALKLQRFIEQARNTTTKIGFSTVVLKDNTTQKLVLWNTETLANDEHEDDEYLDEFKWRDEGYRLTLKTSQSDNDDQVFIYTDGTTDPFALYLNADKVSYALMFNGTAASGYISETEVN